MNSESRKDHIIKIFSAALRAADTHRAVLPHTQKILSLYTDGGYKRLILVGFGKAVSPMARQFMDSLGGVIPEGVLITKYGHGGETAKEKRVNTWEAGHPLPDENGIKATEEIIRLLEDAEEESLVVCLISGGGSSLLVSPWAGISLSEKQTATDILLRAGAGISELNTVRKHISRVKGGRLAELASPARTISLILSDVIGDRLDVIASGPTSPDNTTYDDAMKVIERYGLKDTMPWSIIETLERGRRGLISETPKEGSAVFQRVENIIVGSNKKAIDAAKADAVALGFQTSVVSTEIQGEARFIGKWLAKKAVGMKASLPGSRICLISGGETTVAVKGKGKGGRNMELALAFALEIEGFEGITFLSAGTDGTDGPTDAAGAIVDGHSITKAKSLGINGEEYLNNNDSYNFFKKVGGLFITGPTGTNVMDLQITLLDS